VNRAAKRRMLREAGAKRAQGKGGRRGAIRAGVAASQARHPSAASKVLERPSGLTVVTYDEDVAKKLSRGLTVPRS